MTKRLYNQLDRIEKARTNYLRAKNWTLGILAILLFANLLLWEYKPINGQKAVCHKLFAHTGLCMTY